MTDDEKVEAAADVLYASGTRYGWWKNQPPSWRDLDSIGREEFLAEVAAIIDAYHAAGGRDLEAPLLAPDIENFA